jgi:hypothetical protein
MEKEFREIIRRHSNGFGLLRMIGMQKDNIAWG